MVKKNFNKLDKLQVIFAISAAILAVISFTFEDYYWMFRIVYILLALNLMTFAVQRLKQTKNAPISLLILVMAVLIIFLSIFP
ncbi:hypothetical protein [Fredinandcohnia sp. 179-A 10B2 NHS]|uniref:hypothetical protein n=1 Tax=Fredinandcohnia sp. 179-A 10B2 NHS TaxID=3235176 RepID=UPI00399F6A7C